MTDTKTLTHYIGMNGSSGCVPDSCNAYSSEQDAVDSLSDLLELTDQQSKELLDTGYVSCAPDQGADYAEVTACTCGKPWEHSDGDDADNWPDYVKAQVQAFLDTLEVHTYTDRSKDTWEDKKFYILPYASFSDYSGSGVERANSKDFKETFPFVSEMHGDYGTVWTGIDEDDIEEITARHLEELIETCQALERYPIISEDTLSHVETELQQEAWENWAKSDFRKELAKQFAEQNPDQPADYWEEFFDEYPEDELADLFYKAAEASNTYWEIEEGANAHIRIERVVEAVTFEMLTTKPEAKEGE